MDNIVSVRWNHGGIFVNDNSYSGGDVYIDYLYDIDKFSLFEFLATTRYLGYNTVSGFFIRDINDDGFRHLYSDEVILEWVKELRNGEIVDVFVEHRADKPQLHNPMQDITQVENPFNENNPVQYSENDYGPNSILAQNIESGLSFDQSPNTDHAPNTDPNGSTDLIPGRSPNIYLHDDATKVTELSGNVDINVLAENITSDSSSEEEVELNAGEEEDLECDRDVGSDVDEELRQSRENVREYNRRRRARVAQRLDDDDDILLGETGIDIGFEYFGQRNNRYEGLVGGDEAYYDSSDPGSNVESDEEVENDEQPQPRKSTEKIRYDPNTPIPIFELRMVFTNVYEFREAVAKYSVSKGKELRKRPNDIHRVRVKCKTQGCPWLLYAGIEESTNDFIVKNYNPVHRCTRSIKNKLCTSKYIANYFRERIVSQPSIKLREIADLVREKLKVKVGRSKCRRAKMLVLKSVIGDPLVEYARLHDYVEEIKKSNPGTTCFVNYDNKSEPGKHLFKRFYVCFQATKQGWKDGIRNIIGMDGCFLKGPCQGQLLVAVSKDGNDQMFPIAWGIVNLENKKNWRWFIKVLKLDLDIEDGDKLTVVTDMQKGLIPAIQELLPAAEHRMCGRHVWSNWSKKWRGEERRKKFWEVARAPFEKLLKDKLLELDKLGKGIVEDLLYYPIEQWSRAFFTSNSQCDVVENNMSETFNGWILSARFRCIISMLEAIRVQIMTRIVQMREFSNTWICDISPTILKRLEKNKEHAMSCEIIWNGEAGFEVIDGEFGHTVDLKKETCTCRLWQLRGIPCPHAICCIFHKNLNPEDYVAKWYTKEVYLKAYAHSMQPVRGIKLWDETGLPTIVPPTIIKKPGRPKKCRKKARDEPKKVGKLSRHGLTIICSTCKTKGHNKATCPLKGPIPSQESNVNVSASKITSTCAGIGSRSSAMTGPSIGISNSANVNNTTQSSQNMSGNKRGTEVQLRRPKKKLMSGYGVYINDRTGFTMEKFGGGGGRIIRTPSDLKKSSEVTGDLGFQPRKKKWTGKSTITSTQLQKERETQQMNMRRRLNQQTKSSSQPSTSSAVQRNIAQ